MARKSRSQTKAAASGPGGATKGNGKKRSSSKKAAKRNSSKSRSPPPPISRVAKTVADKENETLTHEQKVAKALGQQTANTNTNTNTTLDAAELAKPATVEPVAAAEPASPPAAPLAEQTAVAPAVAASPEVRGCAGSERRARGRAGGITVARSLADRATRGGRRATRRVTRVRVTSDE